VLELRRDTGGRYGPLPPPSRIAASAPKTPVRPLAVIAAAVLTAVSTLLPGTAAATTPPASAQALTSGGIGQMVIGLAAVLALVLAIAWLLRRFSGLRGTGSGVIRVIGGAAVGQRERIVLVEVGGTWLLVGVAPGQVRALHTMPKSESAVTPDSSDRTPGPAPTPADLSFSGWLQRITEKRRHDR
jgi:flagellar protein FliO/FliZ